MALVIGCSRVRLHISKYGGWSVELCVGCTLSWTVPCELFAFSGLLSSVVSRLATSCKRYKIVCYEINSRG